MKKFFSLICIAMLPLLIGCNSEEPTKNSSLIGTWKLMSISEYKIQGSHETKLYEEYLDGVDDVYYKFNEDGTGYMTEEGETVKISWQKIGNQLALFWDGESSSALTGEIKELTNKTLILSRYEGDSRGELKFEKQ